MGNYVTVDDIRAEGVPSGDFPDARVNARIVKWEDIVEKLTRNVFRVLDPGALTFDGNNSHILHFNIPLIEVSEVKINGEDSALAAADFRAFTGIQQPQDDRSNPKIELTGNRETSIFTRTHKEFVKGLDQVITAKWGFVDPSPTTPGAYVTPEGVKGAIVALVIRDLRGYFEQYFQGQQNAMNLPKKRERTDDHEIEWAEPDMPVLKWSMLPPDIAELLSLYRAPMAIDITEGIRFMPTTLIYGY